jgi:hypothetical protein
MNLLATQEASEVERLQTFELTCQRTLVRIFELLLTVRRTGRELEIRDNRIARSIRPVRHDRREGWNEADRRARQHPHRSSRTRSQICQSKPIRSVKMRRTKPISCSCD